MLTSLEIGALGEGIACRFLESKGFSVKSRNYRQKWGEIDIIAEKDGGMRFVEVKTIRHVSGTIEMPEENVHREKLKRLFRTIESYLEEEGRKDEEWQLDVIAVFLDVTKKEANVRFTENVLLE